MRRVSVVVPTRDRPALLRQALASIRAIEGNDLSLEILVGDNGDLAETRKVAEEFGAIYLQVATPGAGAARNAAMQAATGEYLAFLDDDDVWTEAHLRPQLEVLEAQPSLDAVVSRVIYTDPHLAPLSDPLPLAPPGAPDETLRKMLSGWFPQIGTFVARMRVRELSGKFDEKLLGGQDLDWMLRTARRRTLGFDMATSVLFRGRAPGSYDSLQQSRIGFDRRVFFRHALPEWRLWPSPMAFSRAYSGTLMHFFTYFTEAALDRAQRRRRADALGAVFAAFRVFPLRGAYHCIKPGATMQRALLMIAKPQRANPAPPPLSAE